MKNLSVVSLLACVIALCGCSASPISAQQTSSDRETVLLVSREDGSVIMQTISSGADLCFKTSAASSTTCFMQGAAIVAPDTKTIVGFEMTEYHIDLIAKTD